MTERPPASQQNKKRYRQHDTFIHEHKTVQGSTTRSYTRAPKQKRKKICLGPQSYFLSSGVPSLLPVNPSQCPFVQMTYTDVAFLLYYRTCPYDHDDDDVFYLFLQEQKIEDKLHIYL